VAGLCKHDNETLCSIREENSIKFVKDYVILV
jgi:hypothetical protein